MHARAVLAIYMQYITEHGHGHCPYAPAAAVCVIKGDGCRSVVVPQIAHKQHTERLLVVLLLFPLSGCLCVQPLLWSDASVHGQGPGKRYMCK